MKENKPQQIDTCKKPKSDKNKNYTYQFQFRRGGKLNQYLINMKN